MSAELSALPTLLTVQEFSDLVRQHPQTVYLRVRRGLQPGVLRFGRDIRIDWHVALTKTESDSLRFNDSAHT